MSVQTRGRVVVVGGGMLGARIAHDAAEMATSVTLLEAAPALGGLTSAWTIALDDDTTVTWDRFYHVILGQDRRVIAMLEKLGLGDALHFTTVNSELLADGRVLPMSSVLDLLRLPVLDPVSRVRVGATVGLGAVLPVAGGENVTSADWLRRYSGPRATHDLWLPLLRAKLGEEAEFASARFIRSTFRRLLVARLTGGDGDRFGWVEGGYAAVLEKLRLALEAKNVEVRTSSPVTAMRRDGTNGTWVLETPSGQVIADTVVLTPPGPVAATLLAPLAEPGQPDAAAATALRQRLDRIPYLGCVCVSVVLRRPVTGGYLTYVTDDTPYTAVVEMTNLIDPAQVGGHHLVYLPRYCAPDDPAFSEDDDSIVKRCVDDLLSRYPQLSEDDVLAARVAKARNVMPVPVPGRSQDAPPVRTGIPGLYLASSAQITDGTLNVETTLALAERALAVISGPQDDAVTGPDVASTLSTKSPSSGGNPSSANRIRQATTTAASRAAEAARTVRSPSGPRAADGRLTASISLDADNLWSYMKTHGNPEWESRPSYLSALGPRLLDAYGRHGITASVFVVGHDAATDDGSEFVRSLAEAGHEIANHSFEHEPWLHLYSRDRLEEELARTEQAIVAAGAARPVGFRGPGYSLSPTLLELLAERDYSYDATTLPTWIGPMARAYYFRSAKLSRAEREQRKALFGSAREGKRPVAPYRWNLGTATNAVIGERTSSGGLVELPVTTMPGAKVPIHVSYVLHLHQINPALAKAYVSTSLRTCALAGVGPSILLHPLDILDRNDAPGLEFFPGMALPAAEKAAVLDHVLTRLTTTFDVVGTAEHARRVSSQPLRVHDANDAGIASTDESFAAAERSNSE